MSLSTFIKDTTSAEEFIQNFRAHRHDVDYEIYTDGSKSKSGVGAGFGMIGDACGGGFIGRRLHPMSSVFTAELYAIKAALVSLRVYQNRSCVIYSDSRSALQAIQKFGSTNKVVQEIYELIVGLSRRRVTVSFCWIPSHVGIEGNELADKAAKAAAANGVVRRLEVPDSDVIAYIKEKMKERWEEAWHNIQNNRKLRKIQPTTKIPLMKLNRKDHIKITRLRIGHTRLTHGHWLTGEERPVCMECSWDEDDPVCLTVKHIFMECGNYALDKFDFFDPRDTSLRQLLSEPEYITKVIGFLKQSGLYKEI